MSVLYQTMIEGSFESVFHSGVIETPEDFLAAAKNPVNVPVFVFRGHDPIGFAWLNGLSGNYGFGHFCFLNTAWGNETKEAGEMILDYWMAFQDKAGKPLLDVIVGMIPSDNARAAKYVKKLGFVRSGSIPGMLRSAYTGKKMAAEIFYKERAEPFLKIVA